MPTIPLIPIEYKLETDFFKKANYFNMLFASKCTPLSNCSSLPSSLDLETEARLTSINFSDNDILKIIRSLDINKAHGHDDISVRMVKICDDSIKKPLSIIYKNCIKTGIYPNAWKKSNIVPVHKKGDKQNVNNYRPVLLLPIFGKVFEKILFISIFGLFQDFLQNRQQQVLINDQCSSLTPVLSGVYRVLYWPFVLFSSLE